MKTETPEQVSKRHAKEQKELLKWQRIQATPTVAHYFGILMVVITVIYIMDEITSNMNSSMQSSIIFDLFNITSMDVEDPKYAQAITTLGITGLFTGIFFILTPFYKSLADRFGRRPFLAINTCAFGLGLFIIMIAPNIYVYMIGVIVLAFVTPNDVQVMYIMEVAPKQHRAKLCSITKAIALVSVSLIGVMRRVFYVEGDLGWWRKVYLLPVIVCVIVGAASIFFVRETPVFMEERIKYLSKSDEQRALEAQQAAEAKQEAKGGVINAIKFIFAHKQTRALVLCALLFFSTTVYTSYYETIMNGRGGLTPEEVSTAIVIFPFANGLITFISGFISDKFGRKTSCIIMGFGTMITLATFILACRLGWGPVAAGICYGVSIGFLWSMSDTLVLTMPAESVPTAIRSSVMGTMAMLLALGAVIGGVLVFVGQNFFDIGWLCFAICVPFMALSMFVLITKVHETKDVDMDTVTGTEWD